MLASLTARTGERKYLSAARDILETFSGFMAGAPAAACALLVGLADVQELPEPA